MRVGIYVGEGGTPDVGEDHGIALPRACFLSDDYKVGR